MRRVHERLAREAEQPTAYALVQFTRVAALEVRTAAAVDQQRVAGEHAVIHHQREVVVGVAGRMHRVYAHAADRSEEHTSELQSLMRTSYAVFGLKKKIVHNDHN